MPYQQDVFFANDTVVAGDGTFSNPFRGPAGGGLYPE